MSIPQEPSTKTAVSTFQFNQYSGNVVSRGPAKTDLAFSVVIVICLFIYFFYTRKLHVAPQSRTCCSLWNALQVIFVLFTVGTMISMMWFTIILKTSLESMKKRVTSCKLLIPSSSLHEYKSSSNVSLWWIMRAASLHCQKCLNN